jgi:hypothetical protein
MPVEIRELVIKVTVSEQQTERVEARELQELKNKLVKECIEGVLAKLETLPER